MDLLKLIEKIRNQHVYIQDERHFIHKLNVDVDEEINSLIKSMWIIKNQRYICDKLHETQQLSNDPINLINESNKIQRLEFVLGHKKFGANESSLSQLFKHLRDNPKTISYLLFYAEKECSNFLDLICKIIISTIYNHCFFDHDKISLIDMMEELIEIYINFYDDLRRHLHSKNSSFGIVYRSFCDEQSELKTFYKLSLTKPIMSVLSEDSLYLDIDSNRAVMRFMSEEREKHFGLENTQEYKENLNRYQKWTIHKLKYFVNNFIRSLKENIHAFPQSLVWLMIRMYIKLIERFDYQKVNAIFVDMIFFFLLCPAIQNPDLFGITDLHINHIAHYNLMQCAQVLQMLALSNWEKITGPYLHVCSLFDRNCLSFIIEHIFTIAKNTVTHPIQRLSSIDSIQLPHFLISDIELKFLLEYIGLFLERNDQPDQPLNTFYRKLSPSLLNFEHDFGRHSLKSDNSIKSIRKSKSNDYINELDEFSNLNIKNLLANNSENWPTLKCLFNSKQILKISNQDYQNEFIGVKNEDRILKYLKDKQKMILNDAVDMLSEEIDEIFNLEINHNSSPNERKHSMLIDEASNNLASLLSLNDKVEEQTNSVEQASDLINFSTMNEEGDFFAERTMQSLGTLTLQLNDLDDISHSSSGSNLAEIDRKNSTEPSNSNESISNKPNDPIASNQVGKRVMSSFKNIKDKMKISLNKDNNNNKRSSIADLSTGKTIAIIKQTVDIETVKAETLKILGKYRSSTAMKPQQNPETNEITDKLIDLSDNNTENNKDSSLIVEIDFLSDIHCKIYKLLSLIDFSHVHNRYKYLNLHNKDDFIMFLKILLSQCCNEDKTTEMSTSVLIMDIIRIIDDMDQQELLNIFEEIENKWKTKNFYIIYLLKSHQYLLQRLKQLDSIQQSFKKDQSLTDFIIVSFLVRLILEKQEMNIQDLMKKFRDPTRLTDEKASLIQNLIDSIINKLRIQLFTEDQLIFLRQILERHIMNRIYLLAFYPNGDIDQLRDQILHQQINQLSLTLTHNSKLLNIPSQYFTTSPWPSAQAELLQLSAYKTPRDKIQCIYRCCSHIITLLGTCQNCIPSADDLLPVLIFVVVKSNTKSILSTIEYVNTFYLNEMAGEQAYYWTQFCSAVEFIKTILNDS